MGIVDEEPEIPRGQCQPKPTLAAALAFRLCSSSTKVYNQRELNSAVGHRRWNSGCPSSSGSSDRNRHLTPNREAGRAARAGVQLKRSSCSP